MDGTPRSEAAPVRADVARLPVLPVAGLPLWRRAWPRWTAAALVLALLAAAVVLAT
nr:hypothetical protein GCM10020063_043520 [Dactylosporangium thailandense]